MLSSVLVTLLLCSAAASQYLGIVVNYYPKSLDSTPSTEVVVRYKYSSTDCAGMNPLFCEGNCGVANLSISNVVENATDFCQREETTTRVVPGNAPFTLTAGGLNWASLNGTRNDVESSRAVANVELRFRFGNSPEAKINTSPQTTIIPVLRVPSNCPRNLNLLATDPDGDQVQCRYAQSALNECLNCTQPSVLSLTSNCTLSFSATDSSNEGLYAVQLVMEDFPPSDITLYQFDGSNVDKTTSDSISKVPVQFVFQVDPVVPSCTEGAYIPRFLPPTPENRAEISTTVNQTLNINVIAEATSSIITELLVSGPHNVLRSTSGPGNYTLVWTPGDSENGQSHPICFIVQSSYVTSVLQSDLRCISVKVGNFSTVSTTLFAPTTSAPIITATTAITFRPTTTTSTTTPTTTTRIATTAAPRTITTPTTTTRRIATTAAPRNTTTPSTTTRRIATTAAPRNTTTPTTTTRRNAATAAPRTTTTTTLSPRTTVVPGPYTIVAMDVLISTPLSMEADAETILALLKEEFQRRGVPLVSMEIL